LGDGKERKGGIKIKFYYKNKNDYFVSETHPNLCCNRFFNIWTSEEYDIEVYKNGIRYFPYKSNPNIHRIHKQCPFCGEDIKTETI